MAEEIVTGILKSKSEVPGRDGPQCLIELESPWFQSLFKQKFWLPLDVGAPLVTGSNVTLAIYHQGLINSDKHDGSLRWHYKWKFVRMAGDDEVGSSEPIAVAPIPPAQPEQAAAAPQQAAPRPTEDDRQSKIMLQHACSVVAKAYGDWCRMDTATRGTFSDYLKAIAMGATWLLEHVYKPTGYNPQPEPAEEVAEAVETNDPWDQAVDA